MSDQDKDKTPSAAITDKLMTTLNRLTKWRSVFASWQLGTRMDTDAECKAVKDHREVTILLRAETNALVQLLVKKGVFTEDEFNLQLTEEAEHLDKAYQKLFPGFKASDSGMVITPHLAVDTTRGWRP